jgi:hypothetical protein
MADMEFPEVEITREDTLEAADKKVAAAFEALGAPLLGFEGLNSVLPTSAFCHFFQTSLHDRPGVLVVMTADWDEQVTISVLNILLNIRMDPDPPGTLPLVRFYGARAVPPVLHSLFGDSPASNFECQAALVAHFGNDLAPVQSMQLAAAALHLLRHALGVRLGFFAPDADLVLARALIQWFGPEHLPKESSPINSVTVLGFLYGEILRARSAHASRWAMVKDAAPWPALIFGPVPQEASDAPADSGAAGVPQVVFSPIPYVLGAYQDRVETSLRAASDALEAKCVEMLG